MGDLGSIRLAAHGNQTPITPSYIYFLDNRFHPLATLQKVCDAWQRQSEARDRWHSAKRWSTPESRQALDRLNWRLRCHQSLIARLESGQRRVDVVELVVLARAIGFDPYEVLGIVEAATEPDHRI